MSSASDGERQQSKQQNRPRKQLHDVYLGEALDKDAESESAARGFHEIHLSTVNAHSASDKAFTKLAIKVPKLKGEHTLRVKIDTGANANALPLRTFRQMFGNKDPSTLLSPIKNEKLTAYSGEALNCLGSMKIECKSDDSAWMNATFYVVDVPGPVILGLPDCRRLCLVHIKCKLIEAVDRVESIASVEQLKKKYPQQFDAIGNFKAPAKIVLKEGAEPHIDKPRKHNISLLPKIKEEINRMEECDVIKSRSTAIGAPAWCTARRKTAAFASAWIHVTSIMQSSDVPTRLLRWKK